MRNDSIRRSDVINDIEAWFDIIKRNHDILVDNINSIPAVELKQGKWIVRFPYEETGKTRTCSNCNITQTVNVYNGVVQFKFCPYCGARMKGAENE